MRAVEQEGDGVRMSFDAPPELLAYLVEKGSVTVDGVSLTVAGLEDDVFAVALIPHTLSVTTLGALAPGAHGQPRGRRARQVRRAPRGAEVTMTR